MVLSLCMIVKNEEENIKECLDRALEYVDEAIIVDTGSTDNTRNILEDYEKQDKVTIIDYVWENDFSKARNKSIENAKGDYILILDADERIFCDRLKLEEFLLENKGFAYTIAIYNIYENQQMVVSNGMIRLYKNQNPFYNGAIHEQLEIDGKKRLGATIDDKICKIYHFGYSRNAFQIKGKQKRNMDIITAEIERKPKEPFNWYNKGVMEMIAGNLDVAIDDFIKAHELCNGDRMVYHNDLVIRMIQCMLMQKKYKQVIEFINNLVKDPDINKMPDIYYYLGICFKEIKKYELAIKNFRKAIEIGDTTKGISKFGSGSYLPILEWANILKINKNIEQSIEKYKEAVFHHNNVTNQGIEDLKQLLLQENRECELESLDKWLLTEKPDTKEFEKNDVELESYKKEFKERIQSLIERGLLEDTKKMVREYEKFVQDDIEMYSIKGVIAMMEKNMSEAELVLAEGLLLDSNNHDLLYNCGYLFKSIGKSNLSNHFYKKLYYSTDNHEIKNEVEAIIKDSGGTLKNRVLIGSPIYQKPQILIEFLQSLKELNKENIEVSYFFIDDNTIEQSRELLYQFASSEKDVFIYKSEGNDEYACDDNTHHWKEDLVWKVADFKDRIIQDAKSNGYDYLFLIDSDLVLHPDTLKHLLSTGKDIISEIFWTKWQPNSLEVPQVWLQDAYTQYYVERGEILAQNEMQDRRKLFLDKLKVPGVYEVGGLGACTLISLYALNKGVSFKEIKNISFSGEDRHFCIRALSLGLSLYVDTHYPAYHIYREKDLSGVEKYKKTGAK